jgi:hypothetical protein
VDAAEELTLLEEDFGCCVCWDDEDATFLLEELLAVLLPSETFTVSVTLLPSIIHVSVNSPVPTSLWTVPLMVKVFALSSYLQSLSLMDQMFQDCLDGWLLRPLNLMVLMAPPLLTVCVRLPV